MKRALFSFLFVFSAVLWADPASSNARVWNYFHGDSYIRFIVSSDGTNAFVHTNEVGYLGNLPMELIVDTNTSWPLVAEQIVPAKWHVGYLGGDCYHQATLEIAEVADDASWIKATWTIPGYVNAYCAASEKQSWNTYYELKK